MISTENNDKIYIHNILYNIRYSYITYIIIYTEYLYFKTDMFTKYTFYCHTKVIKLLKKNVFFNFVIFIKL